MELTGLTLNNRYNPIKANSWTDARNIFINKGWQSFSNERGFEPHVSLPMPIVGKVNTGVEQVVWLTNNVVSEIGIIKDNVYNPVIREPRFKFNREYPIQGVYTYNYLGELIVAWTDNSESPKILNLHNLPFKSNLTSDLALSNPSEFTLAELFPDSSTPVIDITNVSDGGGNLKSGVYYIAIAYGYEDESITNWLNISRPISIIASNSSQQYGDVEGCDAGTPTNKAILANISNVDVNYTYLYTGVVYKANGIVSAYKLDKYTINESTIKVNIQSLDKASPLELSEILAPTSTYTKIGTITSLQDELIASDLETIPDLNFQEYANKIQVEWTREDEVSLDSEAGSYKDPVTITTKRTFRAGETYGLLAGLRLKKGGIYKLYHIPGRAPNAGDTDYLDASTYPEEGNLDRQVQKFQVHDTATDTSGNGTRGTMGYWENRDEQYPSYFPADVNGNPLAGERIRHHKFPSLRQLENWGSDFVSDKGGTAPTGLTATAGPEPIVIWANPTDYIAFENHTNTTDGYWDTNATNYIAQKNQFVNFDLDFSLSVLEVPVGGRVRVYITRRSQNNNVLEVLVDRWEYWSAPSGNNPRTCSSVVAISTYLEKYQRLNIFIGYDQTPPYTLPYPTSYINASVTSTTQFVAPTGTSFTKPLGLIISNIIIPDSIKPYVDGIEIFYFERSADNMSILDQSIAVANNWNLNAGATLSTAFRFHGFDTLNNRLPIKPTHVSYELKYAKAQSTVTDYVHGALVSSYVTPTIFRTVKSTLLPAHNVATIPNNFSKENCLYLETLNAQPNDVSEHNILINVHAYKTNMYYNMQSQRVVSTGFFNNIENITPTSEFRVYGGDTFISSYGIIVYKDPNEPPQSTTDPAQYLRRIFYFACESSSNIGFRHEGVNQHEKYYPKSDIQDNTIFKDMLLYETGNYYEYNGDYTSIHNLYSPLIDDRQLAFINKFPDRIARSLPIAKESPDLKWRTFIATNYYDMPSNKGRVVNLIGYGNSLFIRQQRSTYRAYIKDVLATLNANTYLTAGDIFDRNPEELIPLEEGYIGCQSKFADIITEHGTVLVDRERGKIWLVGDGIRELTDEDVSEYFATNLNTTVEEYIQYPLSYTLDKYLIAKSGIPIAYKDDSSFIDIINAIDNPYKDKGLVTGYDEKNKRLLFTKLNTVITPERISATQIKELPILVISATGGYRPEAGKTGRITITLNGSLTINLDPAIDILDPSTQYLISANRDTLLYNIKQTILYILTENNMLDLYSVSKTNNEIILQAIDEEVNNSITNVAISSTVLQVADLLQTRYVDTESSFTLSYLVNKYWVSWHDYLPNAYFNTRTRLYVMKNTSLSASSLKHNTLTKFGIYFDDKVKYSSYIDFCTNAKNALTNIILEAVIWQTDVRDKLTKHIQWDKTLTHIMIYNETQCSGLIPITRRTFTNLEGNTTFDQHWVFNNFRDQVLDKTLPFLDDKGNIIPTNVAGSIVTEIEAGKNYEVFGCNTVNDYITYNGIDYTYNDAIITGVEGVTTFEIHGTANLKSFKQWFEKSFIIGNFVTVRLMYDNLEQHEVTVNACKLTSSVKL